MTKILVVSISAPPKNSPESFQTGRYLFALSHTHSVSLLTTRPSAGWAPSEPGLNRFLLKVKHIYSLGLIPYRLSKILGSWVASITAPDENFYFHLQSGSIEFNETPEIIISRSTPFSSAVMGLKLKRRFSVPWIMHLSDPWTDNPFYDRSSKQMKIDTHLEKICFQSADAITVTSKKTLNFYFNKYPNFKDKISILPNVIETSSISKNEFSFSEKLRFVFTGRLYGARSLYLLLEEIGKANEERNFETRVEFIFAGFFDNANLKLLAEYSLKNVTYLGHVTHESALDLQRGAHVLMLIDSLDDDERFDIFFPSKLLEYFAAKRRVIALTRKSSTVNELLTDDIGDCFSRENIETLSGHLKSVLSRFISKDVNYFTVPNNASNFTVESQIINLENLIEKVLKSENCN